MLKNLLYFIAVLFLSLSCYFGYNWFMSEPENREPLPALLSFISSLIITMIGWLDNSKKSDKNNVSLKNIDQGALVDLDPKKETNYNLDTIKGEKTRVIIRGKNTPKNDTNPNNPS